LVVFGAVVLTGTTAGCGGSARPSKTAYVKRVDRVCASPRIRRGVRTAVGGLANLPRDPQARTKTLRAAGRSLASPIQRLTARVRGMPAPDDDQPVIARWLDGLRKLPVLTAQAAATERRILALEAHHPGVVERSGTVRNADLDRARRAKLAAVRTARAYGLDGCARLLAERKAKAGT
jgi:hypothetical protein